MELCATFYEASKTVVHFVNSTSVADALVALSIHVSSHCYIHDLGTCLIVNDCIASLWDISIRHISGDWLISPNSFLYCVMLSNFQNICIVVGRG